MSKNILLLCGGGGTEHEVSLVSAKHIEKVLTLNPKYKVHFVEIGGDQIWKTSSGTECYLDSHQNFHIDGEEIKIHIVVPCIHGYPGETGEIPAFLELKKIPYIGSSPQTSLICFNKVSTKLWLEALGIATTPFIFLTSAASTELDKARDFLKKYPKIFVKASSQGSSVGCFPVIKEESLENSIKEAFKYSDYVLLEKMIEGREFEISVYEYDGEIHASYPGEIICPSKFYSYEEKYAEKSQTMTKVRAENLDEQIAQRMKEEAIKCFRFLNIRHLARIDFLVDSEGIYLNEPNTFPGMTSISLFPKMMESEGHDFSSFLDQVIEKASI